jgi:hypothetical protein
MPAAEVKITGDQLEDVLARELSLDRYVIARRTCEANHEYAIKLVSTEHMDLSAYRRSLKANISQDVLTRLIEAKVPGALSRFLVYKDAAKATDDEAIEACCAAIHHDAYLLARRAGISHAIVMQGIDSGVNPRHFVDLLLRTNATIDEAIEACHADIAGIDYRIALDADITHDEILEVALLHKNRRMFEKYLNLRLAEDGIAISHQQALQQL